MTTYSNLKYDHPFSSNATGTGSLTLISSQTASASANISFTTGIDSTYDEYVFKFVNLRTSVGSSFQFNCSTDNGSNYNVTKTTTFFRAYHYEDDSSTALSYNVNADIAQGTGYQTLASGIGSNSDDNACGYFHLFNPSSTTYVKHFISTVNHNSNFSYQNNIAGYMNTTSAINAIDFKMSSGNIDDGTIILYGVK